MLTNLNLTDMETCYKVIRIEILKQINIEENQFGIEPELTAKFGLKIESESIVVLVPLEKLRFAADVTCLSLASSKIVSQEM